VSKFPHVIAAVEAREKHKGQVEGRDLWAIGDALVKDCGPAIASDSSKHNGSFVKLKAVAAELTKLGYQEYAIVTLTHLRDTATAFPTNRRHYELSFNTHFEANNPDFLDWMVEEHGTDISKRDVRAMWVRWRALETKQRQKKVVAAQERKRTATTEHERRAAEREIAEHKDMPPPRATSVPDKESRHELRSLAEILDIDRNAKAITKMLRDNFTRLRGLDEISEDFAESLVENHQQIAESATQIVNYIKQAKRNGLTVIEGGRKHA